VSEPEKVSREEFDRLWGAYVDLAQRLSGRDRHARGGTTLGEMFNSEGFADAWVEMLCDPEYIRRQVAQNLETWLGEHDGKYSMDGWLQRVGLGVGITNLGEVGRYGESVLHPTELGRRAARAPSMTERKAEHRIARLIDNAKLCLDLAEAFEQRLQAAGGIRRIQ